MGKEVHMIISREGICEGVALSWYVLADDGKVVLAFD